MTKRLLCAACAGIFLLCGLAGATAGEIADLARDAEAKLQAKRPIEAIESLNRALRLAHDQTPLAFRKAIFVADPPTGFGVYHVRADNVFKSSEPLVAYIEPVGVGWTKQSDGTFQSLITVDFEIRSPEGKFLTGKTDFGRFAFTSHERNTEIFTHITLNLTNAPAAKYMLAVIYHDKITGKSATFDLPFEIR
jgi:hypothetical protein